MIFLKQITKPLAVFKQLRADFSVHIGVPTSIKLPSKS